MKRFILLFVVAVFTIVAVSSCCSICSNICQPEPNDRTVKIITKSLESRGNRPIVEPWGMELMFPRDNDGVVWEIDQPLEFTITFEETKDPFPFNDHVFTNKPHDKSKQPALSVESGPFKAGYDPGAKEIFYKYTLEVNGYVMDPMIIVFQ